MLYGYSLIRRIFPGIALLLALSLPLSVAAESAHVAPVNINTASAEILADALQGVGLSKAEDIVSYRKANGPFAKPEDLSNVKGIGESTVQKNRQRIQVK